MRVEMISASDIPEETICRAARGDYRSEWVGPDVPFEDVMAPVDGETIEEKKETLIEHLFRSGHFGVCEHASCTFAIEGISRACMAQLTRHRHASFDVRSMRYVDMKDPDFYWPASFNEKEAANRHGVHEIRMSEADRIEAVQTAYDTVTDTYNELVDAGVPKEDARMVLPLGTKVNLTMSLNLRALFHVFDMRLKADAQSEIRELCELLLDETEDWAPITVGLYKEKRPGQLAP